MNNIKLVNGVEIPQIGYGTWIVENDKQGIEAVATALNNGYSHIDAAAVYGNEKVVGEGILASGVKRENIFVTSKVWNTEHGYYKTIKAFQKTLEDLKLDYLDLYLIHWPHPSSEGDEYVTSLQETWRALEDLYKEGKIRAIGVSNCKIHHLEEIAQTSTVYPMVNQIEFHPSSLNEELREYCIKKNIVIEGYSIYGHGEAFKIDELKYIADKYNTDIGKICLQWALQKGVVALVKSNRKERIIDNIKIGFSLSEEDVAEIDKITTVGGLYLDSDNCSF
jgi:diketogulonate reductase-like aldo/keto reductase